MTETRVNNLEYIYFAKIIPFYTQFGCRRSVAISSTRALAWSTIQWAEVRRAEKTRVRRAARPSTNRRALRAPGVLRGYAFRTSKYRIVWESFNLRLIFPQWNTC